MRFNVLNPMRQNKMLSGPEAFEWGFGDRLFDAVEFLDESIAFALELAEQGGMQRDAADLSNAAEVVAKARMQLDDSVHGAAPAPYRALDLTEGAATWSVEDGYRAEEEAVADLLLSPEARASLYAFDLVERRAKRKPGIPDDVEPRRVRKVGIVGAGLMASQLAALFLRRLEVPVVLRDVRPEAVETALGSIRGEIAGNPRYDEGKARFLGGLVSGSTGYDGFADCDLVIEAVFEEVPVKKQVFGELEAVVRPDCVLATNTSALSVTEMGADLEHPERLVGMHFFNPVAVMPLVELVETPQTDDVTLATAVGRREQLRKRGVLVNDAPGLRRQPAAHAHDVDADGGAGARQHGRGDRRGRAAPRPARWRPRCSCRWSARGLRGTCSRRCTPRTRTASRSRRRCVRSRRAPTRPSPGATRCRSKGSPRACWRRSRTRSAGCWTRASVETVADVDTCLLLGAGFPFFLGGITPHLDASGVSERVLGHRLHELPAAVPA